MSERWARISPLLDELFELEPQGRAARLEAIARQDAELAAELRRLLAADEAAGLLDAGVVQAAPTVMSRLSREEDAVGSEASRAEPGKRVGHYRLLQRVGSGGMGEVWRAERVDDFEQSVAVKLIRPLLDSPALRERFARERSILARLDHPNIARLLDGGVADDGTPWYAMEYVRGTTLGAYASQQGLGLRARVELLLQVCDAVAHAHTQLVVHRDLKPANLLVDGEGRVRVLDFGIARLLDEQADVRLTGTGVRVFSPAYAAPEQIRGDAVGTPADVYALGAVLYELLTGEPPHPARSAAPDRLLAGLAEETAPRPSQALRRIATTGEARAAPQRELPDPDLDTIVATALQPEPGRRYAGAAQLADDLRRWLDGRPIAAQPDTAAYRMRKFVARHRIAVGSASAVLLALIAGLGLALWQANVARQQAARADAEARRATLQAERAERVREFVFALFREQDPLARAKAKAATAGELVERGIAQAGKDFAQDPELEAEVINELAEIQFNLGDIKPSRPHLERVVATRARLHGERSVTYAAALSDLGAVQLQLGERDAAAQSIERSVAILREVAGPDHFETAIAESRLARMLLERGKAAEALPLAEHALRIYEREKGADHVETVRRLYNRGVILEQLDRLDEAEATFRETLARYERSAGADHVQTVYPRTMLGDVLRRKRDYPAAAEAYTAALAAGRATLGDAHPAVGHGAMRLGDLQRRLRRYAEAEASLATAEGVFAPLGAPELGQVYVYRGQLMAQQERHADAVRWYEQAVAHYGKTLGEDNLFTRGAKLSLALRRIEAGDSARGLEEGRAAARALFDSAAEGSFEQAFAHENLGDVLLAAGHADEAVPHFRSAAAVLRKMYGAGHGGVATVEVSLAEALLAAQGDLDEAARLLGDALQVMRQADDGDPSIGEALLTLARVEAARSSGDAAKRALEEARTRLRRDYGPDHPTTREAEALQF